MATASADKRETFLRLAEKRTNEVLKRIRILGNCSNRYAYEYTEEDVRKIFAAIEQELKNTRVRFANGRPEKFTLRGDSR